MTARALAFAGAALALTWSPADAQAADILGSAANFAVLAGSRVTNTGPTLLTGDLGVSAGSEITGFPQGIVTGTTHAGDAVAAQAQIDLTAAYTSLSGLSATSNLTGFDLGDRILTAGVYKFDSSAQLTGGLTLNAQNDPTALFVFQIGSTLTTASSSSVNFINGGNADNVYWQVGSSATLGTGTDFLGSIVALESITLTTGATIEDGRALARTGAVTLDSNTITVPVTATAAPEPGSLGLLLPVFAAAGLVVRRRTK